MSIRTRLVSAYAALFLLIIPSSLYLWHSVQRVYHHNSLRLSIATAEDALHHIASGLNKVIAGEVVAAVSIIEQGLTRFESDYPHPDRFKKVMDADMIGEAGDLWRNYEQYKTSLNLHLPLLRGADSPLPMPLKEQASQLIQQSEPLWLAAERMGDAARARSLSYQTSYGRTLFVLTVVVIVGFSAILMLLYRGITEPVRKLRNLEEMMAVVRTHGDLDVYWESHSAREVDALAAEFNDLVSSLRGSVGEASKIVAQVAANGGQLAKVIAQTTQRLDDQRQQRDRQCCSPSGGSNVIRGGGHRGGRARGAQRRRKGSTVQRRHRLAGDRSGTGGAGGGGAGSTKRGHRQCRGRDWRDR